MSVLRLIRSFLRQPAMMRRKVAHVIRYIRTFGVVRGLRAQFQLLTGTGELSLEIWPEAAPVLVRSGTSDPSAFEQVFLQSAYEPPVPLQPRFIVDGGANAGYASIYFARRYPDARIVAVEPESSNFEFLQRNTAPYAGVSVVQAGIWHEQTPLAIANPDAPKWEFRVHEAEGRETQLEALTIDQLLDRYGADRIDVLKLDIEGAERHVFSDPSAWLDKVRVAFVELHDHLDPQCSEAFYSGIARYGFDILPRGEHVILVSAHLS